MLLSKLELVITRLSMFEAYMAPPRLATQLLKLDWSTLRVDEPYSDMQPPIVALAP